MPKRTEIELSPSHWQRLSQLAKRRKKSVSQPIADAVDQYLQREQQSDWEERKRRALAAVGRFPADSDLAERHDDYLTEYAHSVARNPQGWVFTVHNPLPNISAE